MAVARLLISMRRSCFLGRVCARPPKAAATTASKLLVRTPQLVRTQSCCPSNHASHVEDDVALQPSRRSLVCCLRSVFSNARTAMRWVTTDRRAYRSRRTACARLHAESLASRGEPTRGDAADGIGMPMRSLTCAASRGAARSVVSDSPPSSQHDQNCYERASERPRRSLVNQLRDFQPADDRLGRDSPATGRGRSSTSGPDALRRSDRGRFLYVRRLEG